MKGKKRCREKFSVYRSRMRHCIGENRMIVGLSVLFMMFFTFGVRSALEIISDIVERYLDLKFLPYAGDFFCTAVIFFFLFPILSAILGASCDIITGGNGVSTAAYYCFSSVGRKRGCCIFLLSYVLIAVCVGLGVLWQLFGRHILNDFGRQYDLIFSAIVFLILIYAIVSIFSAGILLPFVAWRFKFENLGLLWFYCLSKTKKARLRVTVYLLFTIPLIAVAVFFPFPMLPLFLPSVFFHLSAYVIYSLDSLCESRNCCLKDDVVKSGHAENMRKINENEACGGEVS